MRKDNFWIRALVTNDYSWIKGKPSEPENTKKIDVMKKDNMDKIKDTDGAGDLGEVVALSLI